jgi:hypothetical protein
VEERREARKTEACKKDETRLSGKNGERDGEKKRAKKVNEA